MNLEFERTQLSDGENMDLLLAEFLTLNYNPF